MRHLAGTTSDAPDFTIVNKGRLSDVLAAIPGELKREEAEVVGILVDADDDPAARWTEVLKKIPGDYRLPDAPMPSGTVATASGLPSIGIWLMPDNVSSGELENFVHEMIPDGNPIWPRAIAFIEGIPITERLFSPNKVLRAKVYAWFATRKRPGLMGEAIREGEMNVDAPVAKAFTNWLRRAVRVTAIETADLSIRSTSPPVESQRIG